MRIFVFSLLFQFVIVPATTGQYSESPASELSVGLKAVDGLFTYGKHIYENTGLDKFGFQPTLRYDYPVKLFTVRDNPVYINLVGETGLLYISSRKFSGSYLSETGDSVHYASRNPLYLPVYFGVYTASAFSVGAEVYFAKAVNNVQDIWGTKFLSVGYNHRLFRLGVALEGYAQVKNRFNGGTFVSFEFLWKIKRQEEY